MGLDVVEVRGEVVLAGGRFGHHHRMPGHSTRAVRRSVGFVGQLLEHPQEGGPVTG